MKKNAQLMLLFLTMIIFNSCEKLKSPTANFEYEISPTDGSVTFKNLSTNATSYSWDFGDENTSTEKDPIHTYYQNKAYLVRLTAYSYEGNSSVSAAVTVTNAISTGDHIFFSISNKTGPIDITVDDVYRGRTNKFFPSGNPRCGEKEAVNVTLSPGIHEYKAYATFSEVTTKGTIKVELGKCTFTVFQ